MFVVWSSMKEMVFTNLKAHRFHPALSKKVLFGVTVRVLEEWHWTKIEKIIISIVMLIRVFQQDMMFCQSLKVQPWCKGVKGGLEKPPSRHQTPGKRHCLSLLCKLFNGFYHKVQHHQPINASAQQGVQRFCRSGSQNSLNRTMTLLNSVQPETWKYFLDLDCISRFVKKQFLPVYFIKDCFCLNRTRSPKALS